MTDVHQRSKVDFVPSLSASTIVFFLLFTLVIMPRQQLFQLLSFFIHCHFHIQNFHRLEHWNKNYTPNCHKPWNRILFLRCDRHDFSEEYTPNASLWMRELPQYKHTYFSCVGLCSHYSFSELLETPSSHHLAAHSRFRKSFQFLSCVF